MAYTDEIEDAPPYDYQPAPPELSPYYGQTGGTFIAPFVDEFGTTHSTARDSSVMDQRQMEAETAARRFKGAQLYSSLREGGATDAEAFRLAAPDLLFNDTRGLLRTIPKTTAPFMPEMTDVEGGRLLRRGPNSVQFIPARNPVVPPEVKAGQLTINEEIKAITADLQRAKKEVEAAEGDPTLQGAAARRARTYQEQLAAAQARRAALMAGENPSSNVTAPSPASETVTRISPQGIEMFRQPITAPESISAPKSSEAISPFKEGSTVRNKKNGKLYKIVNGQPVLAE